MQKEKERDRCSVKLYKNMNRIIFINTNARDSFRSINHLSKNLSCLHTIKQIEPQSLILSHRKCFTNTLEGTTSYILRPWFLAGALFTSDKRLSSQSTNNARNYSSTINKYLHIWRKNPLPIWVGLILIAGLQFRRLKKGVENKEEPLISEQVEAKPVSSWVVHAYESLPLDFISRIAGYVLNDVTLPEWAREPVISWYAKTFNCRIFESEKGDDWSKYKSLGEFFRRRLKHDARPISNAMITSPCDGRILSCGPIEEGKLEQVKGVSYSLKEFLGDYIIPPETEKIQNMDERKGYYEPKKETRLYQCTIYLAPGDYHCFHAPADWTVEVRRHFIGKLLSVRPSLLGKIPHLLSLNERVVYYGKWNPTVHSIEYEKDKSQDCFMAFAAVGATNVGSILVEIDKNLKTNTKTKFKGRKYVEEEFFNQHRSVNLKKGAYFGEFNLGSSVVIVIEAPVDFGFDVISGQKVFVGQPLVSKQK